MDSDLTAAALKALRRILRASDLGSRKLASATGLTASQLLVLQEVEQRGETTPTALAAALQFGQATITNIVDRLENAGLVRRQRSARDKRQILLHVSDAGREILHKAPDLLHSLFSERYSALPAWERAMILAALERLGSILGADSIDAAPLLDAGAIDRRPST
jgi:DNA-binding MarR family transcriptional regulator